MKTYKVVFVGDNSSKKTALLASYVSGNDVGAVPPTVFDNYSYTATLDDAKVSIGLWDTAGQADYDRLRPLSYPQTDLFVVLYSVVNPASFALVTTKWLPEISRHCPKTPFVLIGSEIDLRNDATTIENLKAHGQAPITPEQGMNCAALSGAKLFVECSSSNRASVKEAFDNAVRVIAGMASPGVEALQKEATRLGQEIAGNKKSLITTSKNLSSTHSPSEVMACAIISRNIGGSWLEMEILQVPLANTVSFNSLYAPRLTVFFSCKTSGKYLARLEGSHDIAHLTAGHEHILKTPGNLKDVKIGLLLAKSTLASHLAVSLDNVPSRVTVFVSVNEKVDGHWIEQSASEHSYQDGMMIPVKIPTSSIDLPVSITGSDSSHSVEVLYIAKDQFQTTSTKCKDGKTVTVWEEKPHRVDVTIMEVFYGEPPASDPQASSSSSTGKN